MKFDTGTLLGATAVVVILAIMLNRYSATNSIISNLASSYKTAVQAFPIGT